MVQHVPDTAHAHLGAGQQDDDHLGHDDVEQDEDGVLGQGGDVADLHQPAPDAVAAQPEDAHNADVHHEHSQALQAEKQPIGTG